MAQAALSDARRGKDVGVVALICAAHFVSHYYILLLPPLFLAVQGEFAVSFTQLGLALGAFNLATVLLQLPAGMLTDAWSARAVLLIGLLMGAAGVVAAALSPSFLWLVGAFAVLGIANTAYHPAAYRILVQKVAPARLGYAFSFHTFSGFLGTACAPASLILLERSVGWRGAMAWACGLGVLAAVILLSGWRVLAESPEPAVRRTDHPARIWSAEVIRNFFVFVFLAAANAGLQGYTVAAFVEGYGTSVAAGAAAVSCYLFLLTAGVLVGGVIAERFVRHDLVMAVGLGLSALSIASVGLFHLPPAALLLVFAIGGFTNGIVLPSRDLIVKEAAPPGAFGRVFAIVTTGFSFGSMAAPFLFGLLMDHRLPDGIFLSVAAITLGALLLSLKWPRVRRA